MYIMHYNLYSQILYHFKPLALALENKSDRFELYFYNRKNIYNQYKSIIEKCESFNSKNIAFCAGSDSYSYPFLAYFKNMKNIEVNEFPLWEDSLVKNYVLPEYIACFEVENGDSFVLRENVYNRIYYNGYSIYKKE